MFSCRQATKMVPVRGVMSSNTEHCVTDHAHHQNLKPKENCILTASELFGVCTFMVSPISTKIYFLLFLFLIGQYWIFCLPDNMFVFGWMVWQKLHRIWWLVNYFMESWRILTELWQLLMQPSSRQALHCTCTMRTMQRHWQNNTAVTLSLSA